MVAKDPSSRALQPELRALQSALAEALAEPQEVYQVLDTTLIPAMVRVRAFRKGLFAGQAAFGRCVSKTEWIYGFKVALSVTPEGVVTAFGLAPANCDERSITRSARRRTAGALRGAPRRVMRPTDRN